MSANQPTTEICNKNVPKRKILLSNSPKPFGPLKWKKTVNSFNPKIHQFTQNKVIFYYFFEYTCYFVFI